MDHEETDEQLVARYINCLKYTIQDELIMHMIHNMEEAYQLDLNTQEKHSRQFSQRNNRVRRSTPIPSRGGFTSGRGKLSQTTAKA